jgi:hypothetical protein
VKALKLFLLAFVLAFLAACASTPTKNQATQKAYQTINAYVLLIENGIDRGRIDKATALARVATAKKARAKVEEAERLLASCKVEPCDGTSILQSVQPLLIEYERQLREQQGAVK